MDRIDKRFKTLAERFYSKIQKTDTCWLWVGAKTSQGYGMLKVNRDTKTERVHRIALILEGIHIPDNMVVDHICRNRLCVNPKHLRIVSTGTNVLENSEGLAAKNRIKTHCIHGHEFNEQNTKLIVDRGSLKRACKACIKRWSAERWAFIKKKREQENGLHPIRQ